MIGQGGQISSVGVMVKRICPYIKDDEILKVGNSKLNQLTEFLLKLGKTKTDTEIEKPRPVGKMIQKSLIKV